MAQADLNALKGMMNPAIPVPEAYFSDEIFGFHAQQAAEKCLSRGSPASGGDIRVRMT